jgi:hypothetical protein
VHADATKVAPSGKYWATALIRRDIESLNLNFLYRIEPDIECFSRYPIPMLQNFT